MITYILRHGGVDLWTIVQESHATLSIYPHSGYILDPMPMLKGVWIQEGCLWGGFYTSRVSVWGLFNALVVGKGFWAPFIDAIPSLPFKWFFFSRSLYEWEIADKMFWAATVVAAFLICLGILHSPCQAYHKLFRNSFNSAGIITLLVFIITGGLFFQMCQMYSRLFQDGLVALEFPQGGRNL